MVRVRVYNTVGNWYFPDLALLIPLGTLFATRDLATTGLAYAGFKFVTVVLGYVDVRYLKRIQYENFIMLQLNPELLKVIRKAKQK